MSSGITHFGGSDRFFILAISAISNILSKEVLLIKSEASFLYSLFGQRSPKTQPLVQSTAQFTRSGFIFLAKNSSLDILVFFGLCSRLQNTFLISQTVTQIAGFAIALEIY